MKKLLVASIPIALPYCIAPFVLDIGLLPGYLLLTLYGVIIWATLTWQYRKAQTFKLPLPVAMVVLGIAFLAWCAVNISYGIVPSDSLFNAVRYSTVALIAGGLGTLLANNKQLHAPLLKGVIVSAILSSSIGYYQLIPVAGIIIKYPENTYQITGLLGHKNLFSSWLMLLLPLVAMGILKENNIWKAIGLVAMGMSSMLILLVQSRGTWLSIALALVLLALLLAVLFTLKPTLGKQFWGQNKPKLLLAAAVPLAIIALTFVLKPEMFTTIQKKLSYSINYKGPKNQDNETINERLFLWEHTLNMVNESPLIGHGGGSWRVLFPKYGLQDSRSQHGYIHFQRPHNDWLWITAEYGLVGVALWALFWLAVIAKLVRHFLNHVSSDGNIDNLLLLLVVLLFLINGIFDFPLERSTHLGIMGIVLAMAIAQSNTLVLPRKLSPLLWAACGLGILLCSFTYLRLRGDALATLTYSLNERKDFTRAINISKAASSFIYRIDAVSAPMEYYEGIAWLGLQQNGNALGAFQKAYAQNPNHLLLLNNLGTAWQLNNQPDSAKQYFRKAIAISPRFEEALLNLGAIYFNDRVTDSAYLYLSSIYPDSKNPRYTHSINALLKVEVRLLKQQVEPESAEWQRLDELEQHPEKLFNRYLKAWEKANNSYSRLNRETFLEQLKNSHLP